MARHQLTGGGGIAFQRSGVGDWVALLSKGFTQRHHQSTHFSFFRGPIRFFFPLPPFVWDSKTKMKRGWGYCVSTERRGRLGGTFVQGIHSTSSSINPLLCFFSSRATSSHRLSVRRQTPEERRAVAIGRTPTRSPPSRGDFH